VAAVLGVHVPQELPGSATRHVTVPPRPTKPPAPAFSLSDSEREKIHAARLAFSDAWHVGEPIIDEIAASLGFDRETLRVAPWGSFGLGLANGKRQPKPGRTRREESYAHRSTATWTH